MDGVVGKAGKREVGIEEKMTSISSTVENFLIFFEDLFSLELVNFGLRIQHSALSIQPLSLLLSSSTLRMREKAFVLPLRPDYLASYAVAHPET